MLLDIGLEKDFLHLILKAQATNAKKKKKMTNGIISDKKALHSRVKRQPTKWEKIFVNYPSNKRLIARIHKEFKQFNNDKTNNLIKTEANDLNRHFFKKKIYK
jgi:hypothetical protein